MANNTTRNITYPTSGDSISPLETVFATLATTVDTAMGQLNASDITAGELPIARGGTGAGTAAAALTALNGVSADGYSVAGKNVLLNADFNIWQRGTSSGATGYIADRWRYVLAGGSGKGFTQSRQAFTPGSQPEAGYEGKYFYRVQVSNLGAGGYTAEYIEQPIEDVRTLAGKKVVLSFWAKVTTGTMTLSPQLVQVFGSGGSTAVTSTFTAQSVGIGWTRFTTTLTTSGGTVPALGGKTIGSGDDHYLGLRFLMPNNTLQTLDIWGVQLEEGGVATKFAINGNNKQDELSSCERYYYRIQATAIGQRFGLGQATTTGAGTFIQQFPGKMRIAPTVMETTGTPGNYSIINAAGTAVAATSGPTFFSATNAYSAVFTIASTYTAAGNATQWAAASAAAYLGWSAEY